MDWILGWMKRGCTIKLAVNDVIPIMLLTTVSTGPKQDIFHT